MEARQLFHGLQSTTNMSTSILRTIPYRPLLRNKHFATRSISTTPPNQKPIQGTAQAGKSSENPIFSLGGYSIPKKPDNRTNTEKLNGVTDALDRIFEPNNSGNTAQSIFSNEIPPLPRHRGGNDIVRDVRKSVAYSPIPREKVDLRLSPSLGRTVAVDEKRGVDLNRAFRVMEMNCNRNGVRRQLREQKFHVRRGQKEKELKWARWRKLFKYSFQHTARRCMRLRAQGW